MRRNYYKLRQLSLLQSAIDGCYKLRQLFYYKVRHGLLQIATGITKGDDLILQIATVQSRLYLSNATLWPYELSHVKNEFSLVGLTACQYENGQSETIKQ